MSDRRIRKRFDYAAEAKTLALAVTSKVHPETKRLDPAVPTHASGHLMNNARS